MEKINEYECKFRGGDWGVKYILRGPYIDWGVILLKPNQTMGVHGHHEVEEAFYFIKGSPKIVVNDTEYRVKEGDVVIGGENFGCGSSREHPAVGLAAAGVTAVLVKSVARIFYRSAINQGLPIIVLPEFVDNYNPNETIEIDLENGTITNGVQSYKFPKLPEELLKIFNAGGLIKY